MLLKIKPGYAAILIDGELNSVIREDLLAGGLSYLFKVFPPHAKFSLLRNSWEEEIWVDLETYGCGSTDILKQDHRGEITHDSFQKIGIKP